MLITLVVGIVKGLFKMASRLVSLILATVIACTCTGYATSFVYDNLFAPKVSEVIDDKIEEMGAQETVEQVYTKITEIQVGIAQLQGGEIPDNLKESVARAQSFGTQTSQTLYSLGIDTNAIANNVTSAGEKTINEIKESELFKGLQAKYDDLSSFIGGFGSGIANSAANEVDLSEMDSLLDTIDTLNPIQKADPSVNSQVANALVGVIKGPIIVTITPICFALIYILSLIILAVLLNMIAGLLDKIKIVDKLQKIGGGVLGLLFGAGIAFILVLVIQIFITPTSELYYILTDSKSLVFAEWLKNMVGEVKLDPALLTNIGSKN